MGFNLAGLQIGSQRSSSSSSSRTSQDVFAADLFAQLFGGASDVASGINTQPIAAAANRLFDSGLSFIDDLESGGAGADYLTQRLSSNNGVLDEQIAGLTSDLERFFSESLLPGIRDSSIAHGGLGGTRQGVAEGRAAGDVLREASRGITALRSADIEARDRAALGLADNELNRYSTALAGLPGQLGFAQEAAFAPLSPFVTLAQILGDPTVLTEQESSSTSRSRGYSFGLSG